MTKHALGWKKIHGPDHTEVEIAFEVRVQHLADQILMRSKRIIAFDAQIGKLKAQRANEVQALNDEARELARQARLRNIMRKHHAPDPTKA